MYLWRKLADPRWFAANEERLRATTNAQLVVIERPDRKCIQLEVCCKDAKQARRLADEFGGKIEKLSRDWLKRFSGRQKSEPLKIGKRLVILRARDKREAGSFPYSLVISAGAAFGTGDHVTTAMALRMLERLIRFWGAHAPSRAGDGALAIANFKRTFRRGRRKEHAMCPHTAGKTLRSPNLVVDLGTGSGILALAAKCFGARRVVAMDNDPRAIATARENARVNKIDNISWRIADARRWRFSRKSRLRRSGYGGQVDIVTANLFSELLIEILPRLRVAKQLILSGILREQERSVRRALRANKIDIVEVRRRGKWIAVLANCSGALLSAGP
jgi:ribosomal protein L11 methylase PrmA